MSHAISLIKGYIFTIKIHHYINHRITVTVQKFVSFNVTVSYILITYVMAQRCADIILKCDHWLVYVGAHATGIILNTGPPLIIVLPRYQIPQNL